MDPLSMSLLTLAMIVGRIEIITLFALFSPLYWRS
jgi:Trk-type K+ transport system membrane component